MDNVQDKGNIEFDHSRYTILSQGAEAKVWQGEFLNKSAIIKQRFSKQYRHPTLDTKLTIQRLKSEVRCMIKARKLGIRIPTLYHVDYITNSIYMERIDGHSVKTNIYQGTLTGAALEDLARSIGKAIAILHDGAVIHGDLTTSNMLLVANNELVLIDFGLSYVSNLSEDKAVDLYVLERAFTSAHAEIGGQVFETVLDAYRKNSRLWCSTLNKFADVRMRGRKRSMVG